MYEVLWTEAAKDGLAKLLESLSETSLDAAIAIDEQIEAWESRLSQFKFLCPPSPGNPRFRRCVITRHTSLIYEVRGLRIYIVAIVDNRSATPYF